MAEETLATITDDLTLFFRRRFARGRISELDLRNSRRIYVALGWRLRAVLLIMQYGYACAFVRLHAVVERVRIAQLPGR